MRNFQIFLKIPVFAFARLVDRFSFGIPSIGRLFFVRNVAAALPRRNRPLYRNLFPVFNSALFATYRFFRASPSRRIPACAKIYLLRMGDILRILVFCPSPRKRVATRASGGQFTMYGRDFAHPCFFAPNIANVSPVLRKLIDSVLGRFCAPIFCIAPSLRAWGFQPGKNQPTWRGGDFTSRVFPEPHQENGFSSYRSPNHLDVRDSKINPSWRSESSAQ